MRHRDRWLIVSALSAALAAFAVPARAEEPPDRLMVRFGGYNVSNAETLVRLDANNAPAGVYIDFAETLGGETAANVLRLDGFYRFNDKHGLGFSWYALKFEGHRVLQEQIEWGDQTFAIGTNVDSEIKFDVYKVNYLYSLAHSDEVELGVLAGLHVMGLSMSLEASGVGKSQSESLTAPLPVFGLFARYDFTPRFSAYYNYQFFYINYEDKVKGALQDFLLGAEYRVTPHIALGAALNRFGLRVESRKETTTMYVDTTWSGTMLYASLYF